MYNTRIGVGRTDMSKVYVKQDRTGKLKWYKGTIIGKQRFIRNSMAIFNKPSEKYEEDKLLIKMSNGKKITVWNSETYEAIL